MSPMPHDETPLGALQDRLGYTFRQPALLTCAVTHPSYATDHPDQESNQRLEFLGDAVLQILIAEVLFHLYPDAREGLLSKRRSLLVNRKFLARLAREIGADQCLRYGRSEEQNAGKERPSALSDAFEAIVGAVYLDSDFPTVRRVVLAIYGDLTTRLSASEGDDNPKGRLQEMVQPLHGNDALRYELLRSAGEAHAREYEVAAFLHDIPLGTGRGTSKKLAEEAAAAVALATLRKFGRDSQ